MSSHFSDYGGLCDYPLHRHKHLKRKLYKACIVEHGEDLLHRVQRFVDDLDTDEFARFLHDWAYANLDLVGTNRLGVDGLDRRQAPWTFAKALPGEVKRNGSEAQAKDLRDRLGHFRKRLFLVSVQGRLMDWANDLEGAECIHRIAADQLETGGLKPAKPNALINRVRKDLARHCPEATTEALRARLASDTPDLLRDGLEGRLYTWVVDHAGAEPALAMATERLEASLWADPVLRYLGQALERLCPLPDPAKRRSALRQLRARLFDGTLAATLAQWYERDLGPAVERRIRGRPPGEGDPLWSLLPALFALPERMAGQLSYSMMDLAALLEAGPKPATTDPATASAATAILWTQLWRHLLNAMADLDGYDGIGPERIRTWWKIEKTLAAIRLKWQQEDESLRNDTRVQFLGRPRWEDIPRLAVEVVNRIGERIDIKDPGVIVEYIRAYSDLVPLEDDIPEPAHEENGQEQPLEWLEDCLRQSPKEGGLKPRQREAMTRLYLRGGKDLIRPAYLDKFGVSKQSDEYHEPKALALLADCMKQRLGGNHDH